MEVQGTPLGDDKPVTLDAIINANPNFDQQQPIAPSGEVVDNPQVDAQGNPITVDPNSSTTGKPEPPANEPPATNTEVETFEQTIAKLNNDATLTPEDKEYKALLLDTFKGTGIDAQGNLVDKDNKVVLSSDKLKAYLDNDELPFDANGNVVNDKGEIIKTKEDYLKENSVVIPIIKDIEENFGIKFPEGFTPEESNAGIVEIVNEALKQDRRNTVVGFLDSNPELKAYAQHIALGGTAENYTSSNIDYKNIDIKKLEESAKLDLIKKSFTAQGNPNPEQLVEIIKKSGEEDLNKAVASAVLFLDGKQKETNEARDNAIRQQEIDSAKATDDYWKEVTQVVTKGTIGNIQIPLNKRQAFVDYMNKPVNDKRQSQEMIDAEKEGIEQDLLISYLRFNGGRIDTLATQIARQEKTNLLQDRFKKLKGLSNQTGVPDKGNQNNNAGNGNLSLEDLLGQKK